MIDRAMRTWMLAQWIKLGNNQRSPFQCLEGASGFFTMLTHSHAEGQSGMDIEWISEVSRHNWPLPRGMTMCSRFPIQIHRVLSAECWVHKFGQSQDSHFCRSSALSAADLGLRFRAKCLMGAGCWPATEVKAVLLRYTHSIGSMPTSADLRTEMWHIYTTCNYYRLLYEYGEMMI